MKTIGIFEAKTHLSSLVEEVEKGHEIVITRHGKPVAKLVRAQAGLTEEQIARRRKAVARLRKIANELKINPTHEEIKSWINEGRVVDRPRCLACDRLAAPRGCSSFRARTE